MLVADNYRMSDYEANAFLPYLVNKVRGCGGFASVVLEMCNVNGLLRRFTIFHCHLIFVGGGGGGK